MNCMLVGMKLAITVWNGRIAPLFDVARHIVIVRTDGYGRAAEVVANADLDQDLPRQKAGALIAMGIESLVCGALSLEYEESLLEAGIDVEAFVAGDIEQVLQAWSDGTLHERGFSMPGCGCPRHRCMRHGRHGQHRGPHSP